MQNLKYKILFLILFFSFIFSESSYSQYDKNKIIIADSLFQHKKFTQSFSIYEELLERDRVSSPSMLLKMAYIKEGLGSYTHALYYLNLYFKETNNKDALLKIDAIAKKHELEGYEQSDADMFYAFLQQYSTGTIILLILAGLFFTFCVFYFKKKNKNIILPAALQLFSLGAVFFIMNFSPEHKKGLILVSNTYIMNGPSSGAEIIEVVKPGHLVRILEEQDVWAKVKWRNQPAYIKTKNIKILE